MSEVRTEIVAREEMGKYIKRGFKTKIEAETKLLRLCELADLLKDEFDAEEVKVGVNPSEMYGIICVETDEVIFEDGRSHQFFDYLKLSDFLHFSKSDSGMLRICFGVKDLWVKQ